MNHDDEQQLDAAYRRASAQEAGAPPADLRARILAQAQAEANKRLPVANQSRYWMRAVAGVAVIGVAVMVMRQVDVQLPGEVPQTVAVEAMQESAGGVVADAPLADSPVADAAEQPAELRAEEPATRAANASAEVPPGVGGASSVRMRNARESVAPPVSAAPPPPPPPPAPVLQGAAPQASAEFSRSADRVEQREAEAAGKAQEEVQVAGARRAAAPPATASASASDSVRGSRIAMDPANLPPDTRTATQIVQQHFPEQYAADQAQRLWLLRDANGQVFRVGVLSAGQSLQQITAELEASLGGRRIQAWRAESVRNARGRDITLNLSSVVP